jgi:hypothetical protein
MVDFCCTHSQIEIRDLPLPSVILLNHETNPTLVITIANMGIKKHSTKPPHGYNRYFTIRDPLGPSGSLKNKIKKKENQNQRTTSSPGYYYVPKKDFFFLIKKHWFLYAKWVF